MQYHFVVVYDSDSDTFEMDYDTQEAKFDGSPIYDPTKNEWVELEDSHWGDECSDYARSADAIYSAIRNTKLQGEN